SVSELVGQAVVKYRIVVLDSDYINIFYFCTRTAQWQYGLFRLVVQLVALFRAAHVLLVLDIIEDDQVRTIRAMTQATQLLAAACHLYLDIVAGKNGADLPDSPLTAHLWEI